MAVPINRDRMPGLFLPKPLSRSCGARHRIVDSWLAVIEFKCCTNFCAKIKDTFELFLRED